MRFEILALPVFLWSLTSQAAAICTISDSYLGKPLSIHSIRVEENSRTLALQMDKRLYQHPFDRLEIQLDSKQTSGAEETFSLWLSNGTARDLYGTIQNGKATVYPLLHWDFGGTAPDPADFYYRIDVNCVSAS